MTVPDRPSGDAMERRLEALRREAGETGRVSGVGLVPSGAPFPVPSSEHGYYGLPLVKAPVWTWEVPAYFFVGGIAGAAALIAEVAQVSGDGASLERDARWLAAAGAALSAPLLVADLGRPERFLHMLRVFKIQSPMSVGVWIVTAFSSSAAAALLVQILEGRQRSRWLLRLAGRVAGFFAAVTGLGMATYTGVLIGVTAIPVWAHHGRTLPYLFAFSGLGAAASLLELAGHRHPALQRIGLLAAAVETVMKGRTELDPHRASEPLHGESGRVLRNAAILSGPVPLALRVVAPRSRFLRAIAAASMVAGSLFARVGWVAVGRASARDAREPVGLPERTSGVVDTQLV